MIGAKFTTKMFLKRLDAVGVLTSGQTDRFIHGNDPKADVNVSVAAYLQPSGKKNKACLFETNCSLDEANAKPTRSVLKG